ncbi:MAG: phosphatidate cytidylyltransferase [Helicobacter sp.]|nr:phosphatidate cytidylyltransferase [Helicobacter sp.]
MQKPQKDRSSQMPRYITAAILIAIIAIVLLINNLYLIWALLGICFIIGLRESFVLFEIELSPRYFFAIQVFAGFLWLFALFNGRPVESSAFFAMVLASFLAYFRGDLRVLSVIFYPTLGFLALFGLYKDFGVLSLLWLIIVIAINDIFAYFGGRMFGKTPFCKSSPNKTLEGFVIGLIISLSVGSVLGIGLLHHNFIMSIFLSLLVALFGTFGDLFESFLKRRVDLKDCGGILPGHGGVLDRFDAVLFGAIGLYYLLHFISE